VNRLAGVRSPVRCVIEKKATTAKKAERPTLRKGRAFGEMLLGNDAAADRR
jgi:hypothetical protein